MAAPKGNNNAGKNKIWSDALRKELTGNQNAAKLRKLAKSLITMAEDGNIQAMKEIGDRIEGKPAQVIEGSGDGGEFIISITSDDSTVL